MVEYAPYRQDGGHVFVELTDRCGLLQPFCEFIDKLGPVLVQRDLFSLEEQIGAFKLGLLLFLFEFGCSFLPGFGLSFDDHFSMGAVIAHSLQN